MKIILWIAKIVLNSLIKHGVKLDLNNTDTNDLQEWVDWIDKTLKN